MGKKLTSWYKLKLISSNAPTQFFHTSNMLTRIFFKTPNFLKRQMLTRKANYGAMNGTEGNIGLRRT